MNQNRLSSPVLTRLGRPWFTEPELLRPTKVVREHTVSRFYLRGFANGSTMAGYDLERVCSFSEPLKSVAVRPGFNDLNVGGKVLSTEDWLANIEGKAAPILRRLVDDPESMLCLTDEEEMRLARHIGAQRFRISSFRDWVRAFKQQRIEQRTRPFVRAYIDATRPPEEAALLHKEIETLSDEYWLTREEPTQDAEVQTFMLSQLRGWANCLLGMHWRIGFVDPNWPLYTSDNPVADYASPVLSLAFMHHTYVFPLPRQALLRIDPIPSEIEKPPRRGVRRRKDFNAWETSFARHVVTLRATRFIYGTDTPLSRDCAATCLERIDHWKRVDAIISV